jgi:hypothetical protein
MQIGSGNICSLDHDWIMLVRSGVKRVESHYCRITANQLRLHADPYLHSASLLFISAVDWRLKATLMYWINRKTIKTLVKCGLLLATQQQRSNKVSACLFVCEAIRGDDRAVIQPVFMLFGRGSAVQTVGKSIGTNCCLDTWINLPRQSQSSNFSLVNNLDSSKAIVRTLIVELFALNSRENAELRSCETTAKACRRVELRKRSQTSV